MVPLACGDAMCLAKRYSLGVCLSAQRCCLCLHCVLVQILWEHDTMFHGEDLYMGLLLHRMRRNYTIMVLLLVPMVALRTALTPPTHSPIPR